MTDVHQPPVSEVRQRKLEEPLRQTTWPGALPLDYDDPVFDR
jgi:hypothetical protein